mmetsp:Transcript_13045/g.35530  ORF Transcript_13045/g.35530 Transcript_13045/m.35530 type:complete len:110 (+) Transcript_13045:68-397(+)
MSKSSKLHRPPTPEPEEAPQISLAESLRIQLHQSGERDRLKALLTRKLEDCGWKDDIKEKCEEVINKRGRDNVTTDDIVRAVKPQGRASVPDAIKAELLAEIKKFILRA